jgi:fibronectin-binding autotransporter adhesin
LHSRSRADYAWAWSKAIENKYTTSRVLNSLGGWAMPGTTFTWTGAVSNVGTLAGNWTPAGGPPGSGDTEIANFGTLDFTNYQFSANTLKLNGGTLQVFNDTTLPATSSFNASTTLIADASGTAGLDIFGSFVNQGTILEDGSAGSAFTIDVQETTSGTATLPGIFYNPGTILVDIGNTLTINVGADSEMLNTGYIVADGGTVKITASPSAFVGGDGPVRGFEVIEGDGTLETAAAYPASNGDNGTHSEYEFGDTTPGNTLKIDNIGSFGGAIIQFGAGDTIDLGTLLTVGTLAYSTATSLLSLEAANGTTLATLELVNFGTGLATGSFPVTDGSADGITIGVGTDGDTVLTTSTTLLETSNTSGAWQSGGSWRGGVVPGTTAAPVIGLGASAPFTLTTGGAAVSVGGFAISSPLATVQITSDTTLTTGSVSDYAGTLDITTGNTLSAGALQLYTSATELTIAAGATADLAGRININTAPVDGTWALQPGDNPYAFTVSAGTAVINGALLAGPPTSAGGGGSTTIG